MHLLKDALTKPGSKYAYIAPFRNQAQQIAWKRLLDICRVVPRTKKNEQQLLIEFPNGSSIQLYGADNPDALRGITLNGVIFDEYSQQPGNIFEEIIYPTLSTTKGYAIWIGTPKGKNQLYDLFQKALTHPEEYLTIFKTIEDTISEESGKTVEGLKTSLEDAKKLVASGLMTEDAFQQELYCSFDASVKGAYYATQISDARSEGRIKPVPYDSSLLVYTVWDLGISDAMGIGFYQKDGPQIRMIDYFEDQGKGLPYYFNILKEKGYLYGSHFAPHDINQRELSTGQTRLDTARALGITFNVVPQVPVQDGIDAGRRVFTKVIFDADKTNDFIDLLARYTKKFDDKKGIFLDKPLHNEASHAADVHRYMALVESNFSNDTLLEQPFSLYNHSYA